MMSRRVALGAIGCYIIQQKARAQANDSVQNLLELEPQILVRSDRALTSVRATGKRAIGAIHFIKDGDNYRGHLQKSGAITDYTLQVAWDNRRENFPIWLSWEDKGPIELEISGRTFRSLADVQDRLPTADFESAVSYYLCGRQIFSARPQASRFSELAIRAVKIWFEGAFNLAKDYVYFGIDDHLVHVVDDIQSRSTQDPGLSERWGRIFWNRNRVLFEQYRALDFRTVSDIRRLYLEGRIDDARKLNAAFHERYNEASKKTRAAARQQHGVSAALFEDNRRALPPAQP